MDNWLIFQYHHARVQTEYGLLRKPFGAYRFAKESPSGPTDPARGIR